VIKYPPVEFAGWLDRNTTNSVDLVYLFQPYPSDLMEMQRVSPLVNNVRSESPDLVVPLQDATTIDLDSNPSLL